MLSLGLPWVSGSGLLEGALPACYPSSIMWDQLSWCLFLEIPVACSTQGHVQQLGSSVVRLFLPARDSNYVYCVNSYLVFHVYTGVFNSSDCMWTQTRVYSILCVYSIMFASSAPPSAAGCCFLFGGWKYKVQKFNAVANQASSSLLFLSCIGIIIPTAAGYLEIGPGGGGKEAVMAISRGAAIVLLLL